MKSIQYLFKKNKIHNFSNSNFFVALFIKLKNSSVKFNNKVIILVKCNLHFTNFIY